MNVVQIVSRLPPSIDGVGDYAFLLAQQLRTAYGINTHFVVCDTDWKPEDAGQRTEGGEGKSEIGNRKSEMQLDGFPVHQLREPSAAELLSVLSQAGMPQTVLLQYVGYGYEKRGCPVWLVNGIDAWRKAQSAKRLVTMFHELYAFGPPWRSSFWTSPVQRWIAQTLARRSDHCFTNRMVSATWLAAASQHQVNAISVLPVFSNLGEQESVMPLALRKPQMLVYGGLSRSPNDRDLAARAIHQACKGLGIKRLITFGSKALDPAHMGIPVENLGFLTNQDAGKLLSESRAGYLDYFDGYLAKSGIFAAYCAHGLLPLVLHENRSAADGLKMGTHFWVAKEMPGDTGLVAQQCVRDQASQWYGCHSVAETAQLVLSRLMFDQTC
jgi:hypothetical protein